VQQRAGDVGLADFSVGAGDEVGAGHGFDVLGFSGRGRFNSTMAPFNSLGGQRLEADIELAFHEGDCNGLALK
jgi:hypothetical protein